MTSAWLIYSTIALSGFPAQSWTSIEYPSRPICDAQARAFIAHLMTPEAKADRDAKQIRIKIEPRCTSQPPQFFIVDGGSQ
jgi:hypothetical protein